MGAPKESLAKNAVARIINKDVIQEKSQRTTRTPKYLRN